MGLYTLKPVRVFIIYYTCQCNVMSSEVKHHLATCAVTLLVKVFVQRLRVLRNQSLDNQLVENSEKIQCNHWATTDFS